MKKEEIVDMIIAALQEKDVLDGYHKMQNGKAMQIKTKDGSYFNIATVKLMKGEGYIVQKLR